MSIFFLIIGSRYWHKKTPIYNLDNLFRKNKIIVIFHGFYGSSCFGYRFPVVIWRFKIVTSLLLAIILFNIGRYICIFRKSASYRWKRRTEYKKLSYTAAQITFVIKTFYLLFIFLLLGGGWGCNIIENFSYCRFTERHCLPECRERVFLTPLQNRNVSLSISWQCLTRLHFTKQ
jgi:hypothetical protein